LGDEDTVALYGSFDWGHDAGGYAQESSKKAVSWHTQCGGGLDGGVVFRNQRRSVVKAVAQSSATENSSRTTAEVFAFGKTIWKGSGAGSLQPKSIKSEFNAISYPVIPGVITARVSAYTQAELGLATSVKGSSAPVSCTSTATPSAKSTLGASVNLDLIGFGDVSLGSFGIGGQVKAFDLRLPTQGGIGVK